MVKRKMRGGVEMKGDRRRWIGEGRWKMGGGVRREMGDRVSSVCWVMGVGVSERERGTPN